MRSLTARLLAGCVGAALAPAVFAQQPTITSTPAPFQMPGTPVGKGIVPPVGSSLPKAAPSAGAPIGSGPGGIPGPLDPRLQRPPGQMIDLKNVIAPYPGMPKPAPSFWEKLEERWMSLFGSNQPAQRPTTYTPGISRRNKERREAREQMRWRD